MERFQAIVREDSDVYAAMINYDSPFIGAGTCPHNVAAYVSDLDKKERVFAVLLRVYMQMHPDRRHIEFENLRRSLLQ